MAHKCPTCGDAFDTLHGRNIHHTKVHGESITQVERTCEHCGNTFTTQKCNVENGGGKYCSRDCANKRPDARVEKQCQYCGDTYSVKKSQIKHRGSSYCSNKCYNEGKKDRIWRECKECNSEYWINPYRDDTHKGYCSIDCIEKSNHTTIECENCGDDFRVYIWHVVNGNRRYCSKSCFHSSFTGENHPHWNPDYKDDYGSNWPQQREKALERDGEKCVVCGDGVDELGRRPDVHHIVPISDFKNKEAGNILSNLICLCRKHHTDVERGNRTAPKPNTALQPINT